MLRNSWRQLLHNLLHDSSSRPGRKSPRRRIRPWVEILENRITPTTITAPDIADTTLIQVSSSATASQLSDGAGPTFFVGETSHSGTDGAATLRRGALKFDLSAVPAGSTITSVTLTLIQVRDHTGSPENVGLFAAQSDWGEGTSLGGGNAGTAGGQGSAATTNDATWYYTFFPTTLWNTPGGDFNATASATTAVANSFGNPVSWTGSGLVTDVQNWVNNPSTNFGWIMIGNETSFGDALGFATKENTSFAAPSLSVTYSSVAAAPTLAITKSHSGNFRQGDAADTYSVQVGNTGTGPTSGTVTVTDTLPAGLSPTAADNGTISGWSVSASGQQITATRSDALAAGGSYPSFTVTVSVANNAPASVTNSATVSGGGAASPANASDPTTITQVADMTISLSHTGNFKEGDSADTYTVTVNNSGAGPTTGTVTVSDTLPTGLSPTAADSGTINGWSVSTSGQTITATRSDVLAAGGTYPALTITVSVASVAPSSVTNTATVAGGGELNTSNDSASDPTTITVVATKLAINTSSTATAGTPFNFTVTAEDGGGSTATGFSGAVTLSSSAGADISPTSMVLTSGTATIPLTLTTAGSQTVTAAFTGLTSGTAIIAVSAGAFNKYLVTVPSSTAAGTGFLLSVQAADQNGNPVTSYSGPATVTATISPTSSASNFPATVSINNKGLGLFVGNLDLVGSYTITVTGSTFTGTSGTITVMPGPAVKLAFLTQPVNTPTGVALPAVTVQLEDPFGNFVTASTQSVTLSVASGPGSFSSGSTTTVKLTNGQATFTNLTLIQPGSYALRELVPGLYTGPNSNTFSVVPLQVTTGSFASSPSGFSLTFNGPILVTATTPALYGTGFAASAPAPSVTLTQIKDGSGNPVTVAIAGSVVLNTSTSSLNFIETDTNALGTTNPPILPDGTYVARLRSSGPTGFQAINSGGGFLDGLGTGTPGSGDFTATFTAGAAAAHDDIVWVPATADGPGQALVAPGQNQAGGGYPIFLDDSTGTVTSVQVTLNYNPALLTVSGVTGSGFSLQPSSTPGHAVLQYSGPALAKGTQTPIGFVTATVYPGTTSSPAPYKAKDLLHLSAISLNGGAVNVVGGDALHLMAYVGDADGNASYNSNDAVLLTRVALQTDTGFAAYPLVDPAIVGDTDGSGFIPADAALQANEAGVGFQTSTLANPPIPSGTVIQLGGNSQDPIHHLALVAGNSLSQVGTVHPSVHRTDGAGQTSIIGATKTLSFDLSWVPAGFMRTSGPTINAAGSAGPTGGSRSSALTLTVSVPSDVSAVPSQTITVTGGGAVADNSGDLGAGMLAAGLTPVLA